MPLDRKGGAPEITKRIVYLDTYVWSNIVKARRGEGDGRWSDLFQALLAAVGENVITCVSSWLVREEVELSQFADEAMRLLESLGGIKCHDHRLEQFQLHRALNRFIAGEPPLTEVEHPWRDVLDENPHRWLPRFNVNVHLPTPEAWIEEQRIGKVTGERRARRCSRRTPGGVGRSRRSRRVSRERRRSAMSPCSMHASRCLRLGTATPSRPRLTRGHPKN